MSSADFFGIASIIFLAALAPKPVLWVLWAITLILSLVLGFLK